MKLMPEQIAQFDRDGYLFFPRLFTTEEIRVLLDEVPRLYAQQRPENVREKGSDAVRTNFAAHMYSYPFAKLARHPRMVEPVMQIFGEPVYMHQFKINGKMAFEGDLWQWHQDYGTWKNDDLMPEARAMNVAIFLDEVNEFNGPLMFIPGSHKLGVIDAGYDVTTTSYPLWTINHETIRKLVERGGREAPMSLYAKLCERAAQGKPLRIGLIGAGKFGAMYLAQAPKTPGVHVVGIADLSPTKARTNLERVGWPAERYAAASLDAAFTSGATHLGDDWQALVAHPQIDIIVEATGNPGAAVDHVLAAFMHGKHVVMVTVEADAVCGPLLARRAQEAGG